MKKDPLSRLVNLIREEGKKYNPPSIILSKVISPPPNLKIEYRGVEIDKDNILISQYLLTDYKRTYEVIEGTEEEEVESVFSFDIADGEFSGDTKNAKAGVTGQATESPTGHKHDINIFNTKDNKFTSKGTFKFTDTLKEGDLLAVMPTEDWQTFIVLDKVVSLE